MFTIDTMVDSVQNGKKTFVKTFVKNETIADAMNAFIDAQSMYTKSAAKVGLDTVLSITSEMVKLSQDANKFDYVKFGEGVMKAYFAQQKAASAK
ncbi:hypothetical protein EBR43_09740 [bacterium]|nr:hypothetical protein [bacterium]